MPKKKWHAKCVLCQILTSKRATPCHAFKLNEFQFWDRISAAFIELHWNPRDFFCNFHSNRIKSSITSMKSIIYYLYTLYIYTSIHPSTFILLYENFNYYPPTATVFRCPFQLFPLFAMDSGLNIELVKWFSVGSLMLVSAHVTWFSSLIFARHSTRRCSLLFLFKLDLLRIELIFLLYVIILMMYLESVGSNVFVQTIILAHNLFTKCAS